MQNNTWEEFKNKKIELFNKELKIFLEKINGIRSNQISLEVIRRLTINCQKEIKPVNALANLKVLSNELIIKPFDPKMLSVIEKAILDSQLGYNTEKKTKEEIYFSLSPINTEIKKTLIKKANQISQETNKWFRLIHQDLKKWLKKDKDSSQDYKKNCEKLSDKIIKEYQDKVKAVLEKKSLELNS